MARPIVMPSLGMFTAEGTLTAWLCSNGAHVAAGDPVAEVTTEKTTQELVAPGAGIVHQIAAAGANLPVQGLIGYILAEGEAPPTTAPMSATPPTAQSSAIPALQAPNPAARPSTVGGEVRASPIARRLSAENGIDLSTLTGTGPGGRIVEADVLAAVARSAVAPSAGPPPDARKVRERIAIQGIRRTIGERLRSSLATAASVSLTREVDADVLVAVRARLGERIGASVPYDALFIKLLATALRERPELNAVIENDAILVLENIHVGFAVAVPGALLVPVVHDADTRPLSEIVGAIGALSERARSNQLRPEDVGGGTITITNLGHFGIDGFTPIINPPQSAILGIGRILARPVVRGGQLVAGQTCILSLTFDHRVVDGVPAAQLLEVIARLMNDEVFLDALG